MPNLWWLWSFYKRKKGRRPQCWGLSNPLRDLSESGWDDYVCTWDCRCGVEKSFGRFEVSVGKNYHTADCLVCWKFRWNHLRDANNGALYYTYRACTAFEREQIDTRAIEHRYRAPERKFFVSRNYKKWRKRVREPKKNCGAHSHPSWVQTRAESA